MINIIALTTLLYLVQLLTPNFFKKESGYANRASKALKNLSESLPVFLAIAILSIVLEIEANTSVAIYWLLTRIVFVLIYILGIGLTNKSEGSQGPDKQPVRSLVWILSVGFLIDMTLNLL
jgi:uncharacterized MAPEG superfamily protein